jgi:hypothetical protein
MGIIASMAKSETNRVSTQLTWAREQRLIPWSWIVDETREAETVDAFRDPTEYIETVKHAYRRDRWQDQPQWLEVWSEKGTIRGTLAPVLKEYGITFRVMHGYGSSTALYEAAHATRAAGRVLTVLYLGDWDPSGLHMSLVDLPTRLRHYGGLVDLHHLALTQEDTLDPALDLPSFDVETKGPRDGSRGDPRYRWFRDLCGRRCCELDALNPTLLRARVKQAIRDRLDLHQWEQAGITEAAETESLQTILNTWPGISGPASKYEERP